MPHGFWSWTLLLLVLGLFVAIFVGTMVGNVRIIKDPQSTRLQRREAKKEIWKSVAVIAFAWGTVFFLRGLLWFTRHSNELLVNFIARLTSREWLISALIVGAIGYGAYRIREFDKYRYGFIEIIFGMGGGMVITANLKPDGFYSAIAAYIGCVYVVVRGCDNVAVGRPKELEKRQKRKQRDHLDSFYR